MARRKTVPLKVELEKIFYAAARKIGEDIQETDLIIENLAPDRRAFYYGRRNTLEEMSKFLEAQWDSYTDS